MNAMISTRPGNLTRAPFLAVMVGLVFIAVMVIAPTGADAAIGPKVVKATKSNGLRTIGSLKVGPIGGPGQPLTLADVRREVGPPKKLDKKTCEADYGAGLTLLFVSFGGERKCGDLYLQTAEIKGRKWRVMVANTLYRKGMSASRIPEDAKHFPGFGYRLASMPFIGTHTGTVFARVGDNGRIASIGLFIGGAGD